MSEETLDQMLDRMSPDEYWDRLVRGVAQERDELLVENEFFRTQHAYQYAVVYSDLLTLLKVPPGGSVIHAIERLQAENEKLREALVWCSGSSDFAPGGQARVGFEKLVLPLLQSR